MRRPSLVLILAAVVGLFAATELTPSRGAAQPAANGDHQLAIGIIREDDILHKMSEGKRMEEEGHQRSIEFQQQLQQREQELQDMQKHRDSSVKQGSQQWTDETNAMDDKATKLEIWKQMTQIQFDRWKKQTLKTMYDHIEAAAAQVAESQHLDLILADQGPYIGPDMDKVPSMDVLANALAKRTVVFANKKADVTEDVLTVLEANFARDAKIGAPLPPPAPGGAGH